MLWILPINLPTLVVWIHNLTVHWLTPFSSHHNVLSILPFVLLVETLSTGKMLPRLCPTPSPTAPSTRESQTLTKNSTTTTTIPTLPSSQISPSSYLNRTTAPPRLAHHITSILFFALAAYAGLYGVTYAYLLHFIVNGCAAWLMLVYYACGRERGIKGVTDLLENSGPEGDGDGSGDGEKRETKVGSVGSVGGVGSVGNGLEDVNGGAEVEESVSEAERDADADGEKKQTETRAVGSLGRGREKGSRHSHAKKEP